MCWLDTCNICNKKTFAGCGKHIENIMKNIPLSERCKCKRKNFNGFQETCKICKESFQASSEQYLKQVMQAHYYLYPLCKNFKVNI